MRTIFITGASTGPGNATARLFAANGWKVIATMRQPEKSTELAGLDNVTLLSLDVTNPEQIRQTADTAIGMGEIDLVFNNAGYGLTDLPEGASDEQILRQFDINLLAVIRITKAFIPHFKSKGNGLFISTSAAGPSVPIGGLTLCSLNSIYPATKWALEGWSERMALELRRFGIGIKTISAGGIALDLTRRSPDRLPDRSPDQARHEASDGPLNRVMHVFADAFTFSIAEDIAAVVYEAATDGRDQLRYLVPKKFSMSKNPYL